MFIALLSEINWNRFFISLIYMKCRFRVSWLNIKGGYVVSILGLVKKTCQNEGFKSFVFMIDRNMEYGIILDH